MTSAYGLINTLKTKVTFHACIFYLCSPCTQGAGASPSYLRANAASHPKQVATLSQDRRTQTHPSALTLTPMDN